MNLRSKKTIRRFLHRFSFLLLSALAGFSCAGTAEAQLIPRRTAETPPTDGNSGNDAAGETSKRFGQRVVDRLKQANEKASETISGLKDKTTGKSDENDEREEKNRGDSSTQNAHDAAGRSDEPGTLSHSAPVGDDAPYSEERYDLSSSRDVGDVDRVEVLLEVAGETNQETKDSRKITDPMKVVAGFRYEEKLLEFRDGDRLKLKSARNYDLARAKINIGSSSRTPDLDRNHHVVICEIQPTGTTLFSPQGPLKSDQLLLVEGVPGNTLSVDLLLPENEVRIGDSWDIPDRAIKSFLVMDAVEEHQLEATLTSVAEDLAMVEIVGESRGAFLGAYTEMVIQARYQFDLRAKRINWVGMLVHEQRSIGHVGPGLDVKAKLQVKISPNVQTPTLTEDVLGDWDSKASDSLLRLRYEDGKAPWRFRYPRHWYLIEEETKTTLLRMLDKGELVAQCNIVSMPQVDPKTSVSLKRFTADLKSGLGKNFGTLVASEERVDASGNLELRVVIDGAVNDLPLRWVYYLVTDKKGNQAVVVFVIEAGNIAKFGGNDETILETFRLIDTSLLPKR